MTESEHPPPHKLCKQKRTKLSQVCHNQNKKHLLKRNILVHDNMAAKHKWNTVTAVKKKTADHQLAITQAGKGNPWS
jgi:hypothetical protein